jgi:hypothetical protein
VDLLGVVVAKMSEKLDQHGEDPRCGQKTALESRDAAQAAKAYALIRSAMAAISAMRSTRPCTAPLDRLEDLAPGPRCRSAG